MRWKPRERTANFTTQVIVNIKVIADFCTKVKFVQYILMGESLIKKSFSNRHPKVCKWLLGKSNCRRQNCDCLHGTLACDDGKQNEAHIFLIFLLTF